MFISKIHEERINFLRSKSHEDGREIWSWNGVENLDWTTNMSSFIHQLNFILSNHFICYSNKKIQFVNVPI